MENFLSRYRPLVMGVLSGFDRVVFRGVLQPLMRKTGMYYFLTDAGVRLLDFKKFAVATTEKVKTAAMSEAVQLNRPVEYLPSAADKEEVARRMWAEKPIKEGLIGVITALEPCMTFEYHRSQTVAERRLRLHPGKCLHLYKYFIDPVFGFMNARIQTWFPFNIQICLNGREWLARQLIEQGRTDFKRVRNCFPWMGDFALAQQQLEAQLRTDWVAALNRIAASLNPAHAEIFGHSPMQYYWSAYQTEWATDIVFHTPSALASVYPDLVRFAMLHLHSPDVMRFLADKAPGNFTGQIMTSFKDRAEGTRVKHWLRGNSVKMYDKAASILRIETTLGQTEDFKVYRPKTNGSPDQLAWLPLRKGIADLHRRAQVSHRANSRYLESLSSVSDTLPCRTVFDSVSRPITLPTGRRVRALRLHDPDDLALLDVIARGEFAISGFRNRDLRRHLFPNATEPDRPRLSARTSRLLAILRAHGVIHRVQKTNRYRLTTRGHRLTAALFAARNANINQLIQQAA